MNQKIKKKIYNQLDIFSRILAGIFFILLIYAILKEDVVLVLTLVICSFLLGAIVFFQILIKFFRRLKKKK
jgi:hypothetical protein